MWKSSVFLMSKKKQSSQNESDIKLIRKANEFVEARYKFDIWETRVFAYMLTLIHYSDTDFAEYKINVGDIISEFNLSRAGSVYEEIKKASEKLLSKKVQIERISPSGAVEILDTYLVVSTSRPKKEQKDNNLSEDDLKKNSNEVQKITDLKIADIDKKLSEKEVEILKV